MVPRRMSAMSPRRSVLAWPEALLTARIGRRFRSSTERSAPCTRTWKFCVPASSRPAPSTAFCADNWATTWFMSRPNWASRFCEISTKIFSACTPNSSTLATSGTRSSWVRTCSANTRSSSSLKPSADSAKMLP